MTTSLLRARRAGLGKQHVCRRLSPGSSAECAKRRWQGRGNIRLMSFIKGCAKCEGNSPRAQEKRQAPDASAQRVGRLAGGVRDALPPQRIELGRRREHQGQVQGVARLPARVREIVLQLPGLRAEMKLPMAGQVERDALVLVAIGRAWRAEIGHRPRQDERAQGEQRGNRDNAESFGPPSGVRGGILNRL